MTDGQEAFCYLSYNDKIRHNLQYNKLNPHISSIFCGQIGSCCVVRDKLLEYLSARSSTG